MYKALCAAIVAALISYLYLPSNLYEGYFTRSNTITLVPDSVNNISAMALASVSRSVVKKVLSVETPEVCMKIC